MSSVAKCSVEDRATAKFTCSSLFLTVKETVNCIHSALKPSIHAGFQSQLIIEWSDRHSLAKIGSGWYSNRRLRIAQTGVDSRKTM